MKGVTRLEHIFVLVLHRAWNRCIVNANCRAAQKHAYNAARAAFLYFEGLFVRVLIGGRTFLSGQYLRGGCSGSHTE